MSIDVLADYHARPGRTAVMLSNWRDVEKRTSYEVLLSRLATEWRHGRVLDMGCGDGFLLEQLRRMGYDHIEGLDRSESELGAARKRLGAGVRLHHGDICSSSLPSASFDIVVTHMVLMLLSPVEQAIDEMVRLSKPGGLVLAVLSRPRSDRALDVFRTHLNHATSTAGMNRLRLGDPRTMSREGLTALLTRVAFDPQRLKIDDFEVGIRATPERLWSKLRLMYDVQCLPSKAREWLGQRSRASWRALGDDGGGTQGNEGVRCTIGMRLVETRRTADHRLRTAPAEISAMGR